MTQITDEQWQRYLNALSHGDADPRAEPQRLFDEMNAAAVSEAEEIHARLATAEGDADDARAKIDKLAAENKALRSEIDDLQGEYDEARLEFERIEDNYATLRERGQWCPIESGPIGQDVLVWGAHEDDEDMTERCYVAFRTDIQPTIWWIAGTMDQVNDPSHWMPLPDTPDALISGDSND